MRTLFELKVKKCEKKKKKEYIHISDSMTMTEDYHFRSSDHHMTTACEKNRVCFNHKDIEENHRKIGKRLTMSVLNCYFSVKLSWNHWQRIETKGNTLIIDFPNLWQKHEWNMESKNMLSKIPTGSWTPEYLNFANVFCNHFSNSMSGVRLYFCLSLG